MRMRLFAIWERLSGSFWLLPAVMVASAIVLALVMTELDHAVQPSDVTVLGWMYSGSPDGARSLLSTVAGSMISVAGVTFSITIATLSLASSQLGPRLLTNFMRDQGNQIVLGTFVSLFTYCLIVLRSIRGSEAVETFVPHLSVTLAMVLAVVSLGVLIYFFHHVSTMIRAQNVIAGIGRELGEGIERLYSVTSYYEHQLRSEDDIPADFEDKAEPVLAQGSGYLQTVDYDMLQQIASERDALMLLKYRPGDFVTRGTELALVYPAEQGDDVADAFTLGSERLRLQDIEFAIDQLVEVAVRALSPGINDPFTAIACLDQLGTTLAELAERTIPDRYNYDGEGRLRLIRDTVTFAGIVGSAFNQIRQHSGTDVAVTLRLLEVIAVILARTQTDSQREPLLRQADMVKRASDELIREPLDREDVDERMAVIRHILEEQTS